MVRWSVHCGDILDVEAEVLVCSANVLLNMSGGVGGAFLLRYGAAMQEALHSHLQRLGVRNVPPGSVIPTASFGAPYRLVLHAVAIDAFYHTDAAVVQRVLRTCLQKSAEASAESVALPLLGTGYGRLPLAVFAEALRPLLIEDFAPVERVVITSPKAETAKALKSLLVWSSATSA